MTRLGAAIAPCAMVFVLSCMLIPVNIPERQDLEAAPASFIAGAGKSDLTPIPGIPMGGYSESGKIARGFWTRLSARAIYLLDDSGTPLVLVACDLLQMPNGLADRVAELLSQNAALRHIGREQMILAASHTHHGPASYFTSLLNTSFSSPSPEGGYDPELFDFLAGRIVEAIEQAVATAQGATLKVNHAGDGNSADNVGKEFFRNRSLEAFLLNRGAGAYLNANAALPTAPCAGEPDACRAVEPSVEILSFVDGANNVIAIAGFLASHPTVLTSQTEVYSSDLFGVTATLLEQGRCAGAPQPVVALFNGAQGDVSPLAVRRDRYGLLELSERVADKICDLLPSSVASPVDISFRFAILDGVRKQAFDDPTRDGDFERRTVNRPRPGEGQLGGAEDGRTFFFEMGFQEGRRAVKRDDHGAKRPVLGGLGEFMLGLVPPPSRAPLGVYQIGPFAIVTLPGEFTTMMGQRVRNRVKAAMTSPPTRVLLAGLANGHVSYVTTPEEYDSQQFEGASSFYGAATGPLLAKTLAELAAKLPGSNEPESIQHIHVASGSKVFAPANAWGPPYYVDEGLAELAIDLKPPFRPNRNFPAFCWYDSVPRLSGIEPAGLCKRSVPEVSVHLASTGVVQTSDDGLELVTVMVGVESHRTEWCSIWLVPDDLPPDGGQFRFHVERIRGVAAKSLPFLPGAPFLDRRGDAPLEPSGASSFTCQDVPPFP